MSSDKKSQRSKQTKILILVLLLIAVAAGIWFWRQQSGKSANQGTDSSVDSVESAEEAGLIDPTDTGEWSQVLLGPALVNDGSDEVGASIGYRFRLPIGWTVKTCENTASMTAHVSPDADTQTTCNSEGFAPIVLNAQKGDLSEGFDYSDTTIYSEVQTESVTIDGKVFRRDTVTVENPLEFGPPAGTVIVSYFLVLDGVTYSASYVHRPTDSSDLTETFDQLFQTLVITTPTVPPES